MKHWVFDLDGTLVDSFNPYFTIVEEFIGEKLSPTDKQRLIGMHPAAIFVERLPEKKAHEAISELRSRSQNDARSIAMFPHVNQIFKELTANGNKISVWTSRDLNSAKIILQSTGLSQHVDHVVSGECVAKRKPDPEGLFKIQKLYQCELHQMVMIGDHNHDMEAANAAKVFSVRASWHGHWDDGHCSKSNKQFFSDQDFSRWIDEIHASSP